MFKRLKAWYLTNGYNKRVESFLWRALVGIVAAGVTWLLSNLGNLSLSPTVTAILGLVLGEEIGRAHV